MYTMGGERLPKPEKTLRTRANQITTIRTMDPTTTIRTTWTQNLHSMEDQTPMYGQTTTMRIMERITTIRNTMPQNLRPMD